MKVELEWKEPPPADARRGPRTGKQKVVDLLKKHPGRWALVQKDMSSSGAGSVWRKLGVEVEVRGKKTEDGKRTYDIYARYAPEDGEEDEMNKTDLNPAERRKLLGLPIPKGSAEEREDHERTELSRQHAIEQQERQDDRDAAAEEKPRMNTVRVPGQPARKQWTVNGKVRTDPPPEPLEVPEGETPAEARTRKSADRMAMDRWKRGVPRDGTPVLAGRVGPHSG